MQEKVSDVVTSEDAANVVQEFDQIIKNKKAILYDWPTIKGKFQKFTEKEQFVNMVSKFGVGKSTIVFKIALFKLINNLKISK